MARPALSASRTVTVLNFLAERSPDGFTLSGIADELDINLASCHALLAVLTDAGYVSRDRRLKTYSLGSVLVALGNAAVRRHPAIEHAHEQARLLSEDLKLAVTVTALAGQDIAFLERVGKHRPRDIGVQVGQRIAMIPPVGAVFAAWHDPEAWLARASDRPAMEAVLADVRSRGWAVALGNPGSTDYQALGPINTRRRYDAAMIAAPVFGRDAEAVVSLTLLGMEPGLSARDLVALGERVRDGGLVATRRSGGRTPPR
jgi:DNA-binding IclR family transcriptional regulator